VSSESTALEPPEGTQALLFDCDGTLVDTLSLYRVCWRQAFGRRGFDMSDEWFAEHAGVHVHDFVAAAFPEADPAERAAITDEGMTMFLASTHLLEPLEHVVEIARACHGRIPLAVVSSGPGDAVRESLDAVGITSMFDVILTLDDVTAGKPDPEGYLLAIERLGADPAHCVAYEDSTVGMDAARAAGIPRVVDVRRHTPDTF
jgi:beta-phosphoglucomutase-like phosphatase (HAD superfamily)